MHLFYTPGISGERYQLDEQESKHAIRVLRLRAGDRVVAVDGRGGWHEALVESEDPGRCTLKVTSRTSGYQPLPYELHMAVSPTRQPDRFEWFVEKATEIGVSAITPLMCHRTERSRIRNDRLERILVSAMKQSLRAWKPVLYEPVTLDRFLESNREGTRGVAHCMPGERKAVVDLPVSGKYTLLVGPEGDFTEEELEMVSHSGYLPFHLGRARLRTETAGVHIVSAIRLRHM